MSNGSNFWNLSFWNILLCLALIFACVILANIIIRTVKPLRKTLIPSTVLAGFFVIFFLWIIRLIIPEEIGLFQSSTFEILTYHALGIAFISSSLKHKVNKDKSSQGGYVKSSFITIGSYAIQAVVGLTITIILFLIMGTVWPASGVLLPMGFGQGPGQAYNWGTIFSNYVAVEDPSNPALIVSEFGGFNFGTTFGLAIASMGFITASIGGVIYLNIQRKKGNPKVTKKLNEYVEQLTLEDYEEKGEIGSSDTVDKATIQIAIILLVYALTFLVLFGITKACEASGVKFLINTVVPLLWGFHFIVGVAFASIFKIIFNKLHTNGLIKKQYVNNYMMDRISGVSFDVMVVAAFAAISLDAFKHLEIVLPLILIVIAGSVVTYFFIQFATKKAFPDYQEEMFLAFYGMLTGTNATGIILLREIDPNFKTPACNNLVYQSLYSILFGFPFLLTLSYVGISWTSMLVCLGIYVLLFTVFMVLICVNFKKKAKVEVKAE